jgi:RNA polymerase sigma-70 factor (ECF subfamily)
MNSLGIKTQRSSEAWARDLRGCGEVQAAAISDLSDLLRRAALYTLNRTAANGIALAPAQATQIAEACARASVLVILQRLPEFRPESTFTTWAYKFVVRHTLAAARW